MYANALVCLNPSFIKLQFHIVCMMNIIGIVTLALCAAASSRASAADEGAAYNLQRAPDYFESFVENYNKNYTSDWEKNKRYSIFKDNLHEINAKNGNATDGPTATYKINKFSDLSKSELIAKFTGLSIPERVSNFCKTIILNQPPDKGPLHFDWREQNKVTSIKNQGACGACWAFATLASVESQFAMRHNRLIDLSEQQLIDCDSVDMGCNGGLLHTAFEEIMRMGGVQTELDYPFVGRNRRCGLDRHRPYVVSLVGCYRYVMVNEEKLKDLLRAVGPIPMAIDAADIVNYYRGVISSCENNGLNHAVLLVGYGVENGVPYWVFKNTWGDDWGENGYFRVRQNVNACGMVNDLASTAVLA
uniref:Viral cathepsin n=1 Tax=Lymantria dispar multicapsid nuclear polyhedrosis virus TaxID=10449 RepID=A0A2S1XB05_NPVLD|nr:v-cath [Lymantria dispar multiple nucleopolyhedrovirus]